ncbi:hypothetical protein B0O79_3923 [Flavobacteriaceae bacterium MAR_2009_75]|nr:hypothetical protein B0O79_3923 [Flavobacteriaceae bacterium MAR_2009_75]
MDKKSIYVFIQYLCYITSHINTRDNNVLKFNTSLTLEDLLGIN